jgi:hypothetical protein
LEVPDRKEQNVVSGANDRLEYDAMDPVALEQSLHLLYQVQLAYEMLQNAEAKNICIEPPIGRAQHARHYV